MTNGLEDANGNAKESGHDNVDGSARRAGVRERSRPVVAVANANVTGVAAETANETVGGDAGPAGRVRSSYNAAR